MFDVRRKVEETNCGDGGFVGEEDRFDVALAGLPVCFEIGEGLGGGMAKMFREMAGAIYRSAMVLVRLRKAVDASGWVLVPSYLAGRDWLQVRYSPHWRAAGRPGGSGRETFRRPARLLARAPAEAGIERSDADVTNAVKHLKCEPRGKRRLHQPSAGEVAAGHLLLKAELATLRPEVVMCLGGRHAIAAGL